MLAGKPIVSTDSEGPTEILENNKDALIVEKDHPGELSIALQKIINEDAEFRLNMVKNAQAKLLERYDIKSVSTKISDVFELITSKSN